MSVSANARRLLQIFERMRHQRPSAAITRLSELGLSHSHVRALHMLAAEPQLAMKDLAEQLSFAPPSVTALTRRLVQTGLVQRNAHTDDSRIALLSLTDAGRALLHDLDSEYLRRLECLLEGLDPDDQILLLDLLEQAVTALHANHS